MTEIRVLVAPEIDLSSLRNDDVINIAMFHKDVWYKQPNGYNYVTHNLIICYVIALFMTYPFISHSILYIFSAIRLCCSAAAFSFDFSRPSIVVELRILDIS